MEIDAYQTYCYQYFREHSMIKFWGMFCIGEYSYFPTTTTACFVSDSSLIFITNIRNSLLDHDFAYLLIQHNNLSTSPSIFPFHAKQGVVYMGHPGPPKLLSSHDVHHNALVSNWDERLTHRFVISLFVYCRLFAPKCAACGQSIVPINVSIRND